MTGGQSMAGHQSLFDQFSSLVGLPVRVQLQGGTTSYGVLYCIDPETDHVALLCPTEQDADYSVKIVLAHHVQSIEKDESGDLLTLNLAELMEEIGGSSNETRDDSAGIGRRREQLGQFLKKNFVEFEVAEEGSLQVFGGAATLCAPFVAVQCNNEQLLRRLQQLLIQFDQQSSPIDP